MKNLVSLFLLLFILSSTTFSQEVILKNGNYVYRETGKPYTGIFKEFDSGSKLAAETSIKAGMLDGISTIYYPSGSKKEVRAYLDGKKHGTWTTWNETGQQTAEAGFLNGKKDGNWFVWDDRGIKRYEMFYKNGEKKGVWIIRDEQGKETSREDFK